MLIGVCHEDFTTRTLLCQELGRAGYETLSARTATEALRRFGTDSGVDAMVIGLVLPDADGRHVVRVLRSAGQTAPAIVLPALDPSRAGGSGSQDDEARPWSVPDLLGQLQELVGERPRSLSPIPGLELDPARHSARTSAGEALLTPTEFRMLAAIASRPDEVVRRHSVIAAGWPDGTEVAENTVDSFMRRIRTKLAAIDAPVVIQTVRGVGFRIR